MKSISALTILSYLAAIASATFYFTGYHLFAAVAAIVGCFIAFQGILKITLTVQFLAFFLNAVFLAGIVMLIDEGSFWLSIATIIASLSVTLRLLWIRKFAYSNYKWFEPVTSLAGIACLLMGVFRGDVAWYAWVCSAALLFQSATTAVIVFYNGVQLFSFISKRYGVDVGGLAPLFSLPDQDGNMVNLSDYRDRQHVLIIFVRGDWCPYCHMTLRTYDKNKEKFLHKNIMIMAIGPDPEGVNRGMVEKLGLGFKVLSDAGLKIANAYGIRLSEYTNPTATKHEEGMPLPASYLIDSKSIVRYTSRPEKPGEFLDPAKIFPVIEKLSSIPRQ